jgi:DNA-binding LytR/AlgR family response regulator
MDGLALARTLKQMHPRLPVLLATGYSEAAQNAGAEFPILRKPYQIHELNEALSRVAPQLRAQHPTLATLKASHCE